jgi:serine/threonine-protein kinase
LWAGSWTPDGQGLAFVESPPTDIADIKFLRRPAGQADALIAGPASESGPSFSPDGQWIAYRSDESGRAEVYVRPFPGPGAPRQISTQGGGQPRWSAAGGELFYVDGTGGFVAVPIRTTPTLEVGAPRVLFVLPFAPAAGLGPRPWDATPDGQRFIFVKPSEDELTPRPIYLVENWFEELRRRVGR